MSGNGFSLTDAAGGVLFDLRGDGNPVRVAWTWAGSDDAWLVLDRNGNGVIDGGQELFGDGTSQPLSPRPNGFLALAVFDQSESGGNRDGVIDWRDAVFAKLRLWRDTNHDGISQPSELHTLSEFGIRAFALKYQEHRWSDPYGNRFRYRAKVESDGQADKWAYDVFLTVAP
jgi:hypothetical protein